MNKQNITIIVLIIVIMFVIAYLQTVNINLVGINQGFEPEQPIAFSHRLHSGDLQITCLYCHPGAERSRHAGLPSANICMNCHRFVPAAWSKILIENQKAKEEKREPKAIISPEIEKLYRAVSFDPSEMKFKGQPFNGEPIRWIRVYDLPDFVYFDHRPHVNAGVTCQQCHGPVETMERVQQVPDLTMGWCVNCHRDVSNGKFPELKGKNPSISCTVCHY